MKFIPPFRPVDARTLAARLAAEDVPVPAPLAKAVALADAADAAKRPPRQRVLDLTADALLDYATLLAVHDLRGVADESPMVAALITIADQGAREAAEELRAGAIAPAIEALRPRFDEAAETVAEAAALGIRADTSPQWVMDAGPAAIDVWQRLRPALGRLNEVAALRIMISTALHVAPTLDHVQNLSVASLDVGAVDYSACFVDPDEGAFTIDGSSHLDRRPGAGIDWLRLAGLTRLRLNTPAEVEQMYRRRSATSRAMSLDGNPAAVLALDAHDVLA